MKTSLLSCVYLLLLLSSCSYKSNETAKEFTLRGYVVGQDSGKIVLSYFHDISRISDTTEIINGKFKFIGKISEPTQAWLSDENDFNTTVIFLEPQNMKISFPKDNYEECQMTGSKTQNESDLLRKMEKPYRDRILALREQRNKLDDSLKNTTDASTKILLEKKEEIDSLWSLLGNKIDSIQLRFLLENPKSFIALVNLVWLGNKEVISLDTTKSLFNRLDNPIKESSYGKRVIEDIRKKGNVQIGAIVPDITIKDIDNQTITLSQFREKNYVLIDFWASWCVPCRESFPHLKLIYNKYHQKGFEIIAISMLDTNKEAWMAAINQENINSWHNAAYTFWDGEKCNEKIMDNIFVPSIPFTLLLDKTGRVIFRHVGYSKEGEESLDKLLLQIFKI